jgi:hypothetical protein
MEVATIDDLLAVLAAWGTCADECCPEDVAPPGGDAMVDGLDLIEIVGRLVAVGAPAHGEQEEVQR